MAIRARGNVKQQTHRNVKAGEFNNSLHEDMAEDDADMTSYPSDLEMNEAWKAGKADATAACVALGMKHADIVEALWNSPWTVDPPNPDVTGFDEYMSRKHSNGNDDDDTGDDDESNGDDDSESSDDDGNDDPMVQQE